MYNPAPVPTTPEQLSTYLAEQLQLIAHAIHEANPEFLRLQALDQQPPKPADGDLVYFPAIDYDPGSGAGLYFYKSSTWNFII